MNLLISTNKTLIDLSILLLRWMTGIIMFVAGAGKVLGWFGGMGLKTTLEMFQSGMGIGTFWASVSCYTEFIGGFLLIIGFLTRPAAFAIFINMLVAVIMIGWKNFFMGGGAFPFSLMISALIIFLTGPMAFSVDAAMTKFRK